MGAIFVVNDYVVSAWRGTPSPFLPLWSKCKYKSAGTAAGRPQPTQEGF